MKIYNLLILGLALLLCVSCSKKEDYREQYTGAWDFALNNTLLTNDSVNSFVIVNSNYQGDITLGELEDQILVNYAKDHTVTLSVDEKGDLSNFPTNSSGGDFSEASNISLYLRWNGPVHDVVHSVSGSKK